MRVLLALALVAVVAAPNAIAGGVPVMPLNVPPPELAPGQTWTARLRVMSWMEEPRGARIRPWVQIENRTTGYRLRKLARPLREESEGIWIFTAQLEFPTPGRWRYSMGEGEWKYGWFAVDIARAAKRPPTPVDAPTDEGTTRFAGIGLLAALGAVGALFLHVSRRGIR